MIDNDWPALPPIGNSVQSGNKSKVLLEIVNGLKILQDISTIENKLDFVIYNKQMHVYCMKPWEVDDLDQSYKGILHKNRWYYDIDLYTWYYIGTDEFIFLKDWYYERF